MAIFTATNSGANMMLLFGWVDGGTPIDVINIENGPGVGPGFANVYEDIDVGYYVKYTGDAPTAFTENVESPTGGTFTGAEIRVPVGLFYVLTGTLSGITATTDNFAEIITEEAYRILDGDDTLNGGSASDTLFGGYEGSDIYTGGGGGDTFFVAAGTTPQQISGTTGETDKITVLDNIQTGFSTLNLRGTALFSINEITINDGLTVQLNSSQIGTFAGVSPNLSIAGAFGAGLLVISMNTGALNLGGFTVTGGVTVSILGTNAKETITGTNGKDILTPGNGNDTVNGLGGNDTFNVIGADSQFDAFNGGGGSDTLKIFGATAFTLNGFNAASQAIEVWAGNGQTLFGNGNANIFNLAGLTSMTGLPFVDGGAGDDTMTGSKFADRLLGGDGNDTMSAGAGIDELEGGLGRDTMAGGVGGDRFDFDAVAEIGKKKGLLDLIIDWGDGDKIDLSSIDANGGKKGDKAFKFLKKEGAKFTDKAGQLAFDQKKGNTFVQGDINGDGKADFKLQVAGTIDFVKADFVL